MFVLWSLGTGDDRAAGQTVPAGWWTGFGPDEDLAGRSLFAAVSGGRADGTFFLATEAGLWQGSASGWRRGGESPAFTPPLVAVSPARPELVLAVSNLLAPTLHPRALTFPPFVTGFVEVSRDGGETFERCFAEPPLPTSSGRTWGENRAIAAVAFAPTAVAEVFLATGEGLLWLDLERCSEVELRDARALTDAIVTRGGSGTILLAATRDSVSDLRRSQDGGASWSLAIPSGPQRARRWSLATQPGDDGVAWALAGTSPVDLFGNKDLGLELWWSPRNGRSWARRSELPVRGVPDDLIVDGSGGLFAVLDAPDGWHLVRSVDGGRAWQDVTPLPTVEPARLALGGSVLVWSSDGRLFESTDSGATWDELAPPRAPEAGRIVVTGEQVVVLEPSPLLSQDGGATWSETELAFPEGLSSTNLGTIRRSPTSGVVYATTAFDAGDVRVLASEDGGLSWTAALLGSPTSGILAVVAGGADRGGDVLVWGRRCSNLCRPELDGQPAETGELLRSEDGGVTWVEVSRPLLQLLTELAALEVDGGTTLAVAASGHLGFPTRHDSLRVSFDGGVTLGDLVPLPALAGAISWVRVLAVVGDAVSLLLGTESGVYRTEDTGATWQRAELHPAAYEALPPAFDPEDENRLWVATNRAGVYESHDAGLTWRSLAGLAAGLAIHDLAFDATTGTLWAATSAGLFARSRPSLGACGANETSHCLAGGRFRVEARFAAGSGGAMEGVAMASAITGDTGAFWFFEPDNLELLVKVLEGCAINDAWWVFATGLTDVEVELVVTDTASGQERSYLAPSGSAFAPRFDTSAFPCP